jgi:hypothetical protein
MLESNDCFGPPQLDYYPIGSGSSWFTKWLKVSPPASGFKIHITPRPEDAEAVARVVLPQARALEIYHKVVRDLERYRRFNESSNRGKFITIYADGAEQGQKLIDLIDLPLARLRVAGLIGPGIVPTTRQSNHRTSEIPVGKSGLISTYWFDDAES